MTIRSLLVAALLMVHVPAHAADLCGDADGSGTVTVTDGVQTLRAAAGLSSSCTLARCDVDDGGSVSVTDGVNVLRAAAGLAVDLRCPGGIFDCPDGEVVVTLDVPEPIGAASLVLTYPAASVSLPGSGDAASARVGILTTTPLFGNGLPNDLDDRVVFSLVATDGLGDGPLLGVVFDCFDIFPPAVAFGCTLSDVFSPDGVTPVEGATCSLEVVP